jgi:serine/threonine protein kinase
LSRVIAGRFALQAEVAAGGMGRVFRAQDRKTGAMVAVKLLRADVAVDAARFDREAEVLAGLSHPHVVGYVAHGVDAGARCWRWSGSPGARSRTAWSAAG